MLYISTVNYKLFLELTDTTKELNENDRKI